MSLLLEETIPGGAHASLIVRRGQSLRITDLRGGANVSVMMVNAAEKSERLNLPDTEITGPCPAPIARIEERYRFQIFLRTRRQLTSLSGLYRTVYVRWVLCRTSIRVLSVRAMASRHRAMYCCCPRTSGPLTKNLFGSPCTATPR